MSGTNLAIPGVVDATEIGRGGFGVVYRATESDLGRDVAVKVLTGELDERTRTRFERERRAMGALSSHPNIITIFRSGVAEDGSLYLVMEYLPGGSLAEHIASVGPTSWEDALRIGVELCGGLESAHRAGVLHRDVKPGNIMMDSLGRSKLGDFGIARLDGSPETKSAVITASVAHAPPEVIAGDRPDERSDVYSLASTLFELVSGSPAFVRSTDESMIPMFARIVHEPAPDLRQLGVPDALASVLETGMAKQADQRYPSAAEFGRALGRAQRQLGTNETRLWIEGEPEPEQMRGQSTRVVATPVSGDQPPPSPGVNVGAGAGAPPGPPGAQPVAGFDNAAPPSVPATPDPRPAPPVTKQSSVPGSQPVPPAPAHPSPIPPPAALSIPAPSQSARPPANPGSGPIPDQGYGPGQSHGPGQSQGPGDGLSLGSRGGLLLAVGGIVLAILAGVAVWAIPGGEREQAGPSTGSDLNRLSSGDTTVTSSPTSTAQTTAPPQSTVPTPETAPPRPALLADLPSLPAIEPQYGQYRTISDSDGAFTLRVPAEWVDDLPTAGQVISSPDNNAALADETISGVVVSGTQSIGVWDANFFLDSLLESLADPDDPCTPVKREPFVDGPFDGLIYAETCSGGELVVDVIVSNAERDAVIFIGVQMIDERDVAAFVEILASFILLDSGQLPPVS